MMSSSAPDRHGATAALLATAQGTGPAALWEDLSLLPGTTLAALASPPRRRTLRRTRPEPLEVQAVLSRHHDTREALADAAQTLLDLVEVTAAPRPALVALARPEPGGHLHALTLDHRAALALLAPTHGWTRQWDTGAAPVPDLDHALHLHGRGHRLSVPDALGHAATQR